MGRLLDAVKTLAVIDELANNVTNLYIAQGHAVVGLFNVALLTETNSLSVKGFEKSSIMSAKAFMTLIDKFIDSGVVEITAASGNKGIISSYLKNAAKHTEKLILNQMLNDIGLVKIDLFRFVVAVDGERSRNKSKQSATIAAKKTVKFVNVDRIGRRRSAQLYIASVIKMWAVSAIYDAYFAKALASGADFIMLSNGETLSQASYYAGMRSQFYQPNTKVLPIQ